MGQNIGGGVLFLQLTLFSEFNLVYNASIGDKCKVGTFIYTASNLLIPALFFA